MKNMIIDQEIINGKFSVLGSPARLHIPKHEGGHLIVIPKREVSERSQLQVTESIEIQLFSVVGGEILKNLFSANWINYQENGNWTLDSNYKQQLHLHIYGRCKGSKTQPYGEAIRLPLRSELNKFGFVKYSDTEINNCRIVAKDILNEAWADTYKQIINEF